MPIFYDKGLEWREDLPAPTRWAHQLDDPWADPARHFTGGELVQELARAMQEALHLPRGQDSDRRPGQR